MIHGVSKLIHNDCSVFFSASTSGWILALIGLNTSVPVGIIMLLIAALFTALSVGSLIMFKKVSQHEEAPWGLHKRKDATNQQNGFKNSYRCWHNESVLLAKGGRRDTVLRFSLIIFKFLHETSHFVKVSYFFFFLQNLFFFASFTWTILHIILWYPIKTKQI